MNEEVELPAACEGCSESLCYPDCDRHASCLFRLQKKGHGSL